MSCKGLIIGGPHNNKEVLLTDTDLKSGQPMDDDSILIFPPSNKDPLRVILLPLDEADDKILKLNDLYEYECPTCTIVKQHQTDNCNCFSCIEIAIVDNHHLCPSFNDLIKNDTNLAQKTACVCQLIQLLQIIIDKKETLMYLIGIMDTIKWSAHLSFMPFKAINGVDLNRLINLLWINKTHMEDFKKILLNQKIISTYI